MSPEAKEWRERMDRMVAALLPQVMDGVGVKSLLSWAVTDAADALDAIDALVGERFPDQDCGPCPKCGGSGTITVEVPFAPSSEAANAPLTYVARPCPLGCPQLPAQFPEPRP